jgi:dTDP-4-dehydrorhamnose 3,5-epimerase
MIFHETSLHGAYVIEMVRRTDERGFFARTLCKREFSALGLETEFVQHSNQLSVRRGTVRGLHFQQPPHQEAKLVRCIRGGLFDVIIDLRASSPTYLRHESFELTGENHLQLYVPPGFAHGTQTLEHYTEVTYAISAYYTSEAEAGLRYDDPAFGIRWPLPVTSISRKDLAWPLSQPGTTAIM